jgi:hypothetical protein
MTTRTITLELTDLQIELLRRWIDQAPSNPYVPMVTSVLPQLPLDTDLEACDRYLDYMHHKSVAAHVSAEGSLPAPHRSGESGSGFQLKAFTPRGVAMVDAIDRVLARIPHGESF